MSKPDYAINRQEFLSFLEKEAKLRIDGFIEGAIEVAEEVHHGVTREDAVYTIPRNAYMASCNRCSKTLSISQPNYY